AQTTTSPVDPMISESTGPTSEDFEDSELDESGQTSSPLEQQPQPADDPQLNQTTAQPGFMDKGMEDGGNMIGPTRVGGGVGFLMGGPVGAIGGAVRGGLGSLATSAATDMGAPKWAANLAGTAVGGIGGGLATGAGATGAAVQSAIGTGLQGLGM